MILYGRNPVLTALESEQHIKKIWISKSAHGDVVEKIKKFARQQQITIDFVSQQAIDKKARAGVTHQGVLADLPEFGYAKFADVLETIKSPERSVTIVLDQITDPQNLGAIIRTAECAGATALIIPAGNASSVNETVIKVSVGAAFYLPIVRSTDLDADILKLKENGVFIAATASEGDVAYTEADYGKRSALVIGNEATGIRKFIKKNASQLIHIPIRGKMESLNASVAAGVCIYEMTKN